MVNLSTTHYTQCIQNVNTFYHIGSNFYYQIGYSFFMNTAPKEFIEWLKGEMLSRNWGVRETAQRVGVSHPTISDILSNEKKPSFDTVIALSKTFKKSPVNLLRLAGMLPPEPEVTIQEEEILNTIRLLDQKAIEEILLLAKMKIEIQKNDKQPKQPEHAVV